MKVGISEHLDSVVYMVKMTKEEMLDVPCRVPYPGDKASDVLIFLYSAAKWQERLAEMKEAAKVHEQAKE